MLAFLAAIPAVAKILEILKSLIVWIKQKFEKQASDIIIENHEAIEELKKASTKEERLEAAKKIQDLLD
jgi:tRNA 2-selenouridine synthase SelU